MVRTLRIAICDYNKSHIAEIDRILKNILFDECEYDLDTFMNVNEVLLKIKSNDFYYDLIFLEIDFPDTNGMEIAKCIRQFKIKSEIIFITKNTSRLRDGYKYRVFDYLIKPVPVTYISEVMHRFLNDYFNSESLFCFKNGREMYNIRLENISHFVSSGRIITVVCQRQQYNYYGKMDDLENVLPEYLFIRPHQSYLVNLNYINTFSREHLKLASNISIPISRNRLDKTVKLLEDYFMTSMI